MPKKEIMECFFNELFFNGAEDGIMMAVSREQNLDTCVTKAASCSV